MTLITLRKVLSVSVLISFVLLFLGWDPLSDLLAQVLPPLQLGPALIRTISDPAVLFIAGLVFLVLLTLIFGRVYCSFLCPLGTLQDLVIAGSRRFGGKPAYVFSRPNNGLRYTILALTAATVSIGSLSLISLLDPYSQTGRIVAYFIQPFLSEIYNLGILALKPLDIYLYPKQTAFVPLEALAVAAGFVLLVVYYAATRGRLYCNAVCPVGTLLGLISRVSLFRFTLDQEGCSECVRCENICKAGCIDARTASMDMSRCVGCFNCLAACSKDTIHYQLRRLPTGSASWSPARRGFVIGSIAAAAAVLLASNTRLRALAGTPSAEAETPVTPPGSENARRYSAACTACSLCVSVCPTQVLTPTFAEFGIAGLLQPKMNYEKSFCEYECNLCSRVCPTGAIGPVGLEEKKLTQIGEAELLKDICVVFVDHRNCGACGEVCPTHAIRFIDKKNILYPEIDRKYCIGCGACQLACPTAPRSIIVHAHLVHKRAEKYVPPESPVQQTRPPDRAFPF